MKRNIPTVSISFKDDAKASPKTYSPPSWATKHSGSKEPLNLKTSFLSYSFHGLCDYKKLYYFSAPGKVRFENKEAKRHAR